MPKDQSPLPDLDTACDTIYAAVQQRAFFEKLASRGHVPRTQAQAEQMLKVADQLAALEEDPVVKRASDQADPYYQAAAALGQLLGEQGIKTAHSRDVTLGHQNAAVHLANDPGIYNAILAIKAAEAAQMARP